MFRTIVRFFIAGMLIWNWIGFAGLVEALDSCKVLIVMTYHEDFFWNQDIKKGLEPVLIDTCELKYVYLDILNNPEDVNDRVQEAYTLYQQWQPDGVITADDDPQSKFVVPYLKDKVETSVIFCGVNAEPELYGYPASDVTGILQRPHIAETITFVRQLVPSVKTIGVMSLDIPAGRGLAEQINLERESYSAKVLDAKYVSTMAGAIATVEQLKPQCDALFLGPLGNLRDAEGNTLTDKDVYPVIAKAFGKATFTLWSQLVPYHVLCAITDRGQEQGETAARMLLKALQGIPVAELPITQNKHGKRFLNTDVLKSLGIKPRSHLLRGVEFVKNTE